MNIWFQVAKNSSSQSSLVSLLKNKLASCALKEWKPKSSRLLLVSFKSRERNVTVIEAYTSTEVSDDDKKRDFYSHLGEIFATIKKQDAIVLMGDFNVEVTIKYGIGNMNENGGLLVDFFNNNKLVIGSSLSHHKCRYKTTWCSPNNCTEN